MKTQAEQMPLTAKRPMLLNFDGYTPTIPIVHDDFRTALKDYRHRSDVLPLLLCGDSLIVLKNLPPESIDCVITSPPYWGKREYENGGLGLESDYREFVNNLAKIIAELKRVLKSTGSFWLNIGDSYQNKNLVGIPWRIVFEMTDRQSVNGS